MEHLRRQASKYGCTRLARLSGLSGVTVWKFSKGLTKRPSWDVVQKITWAVAAAIEQDRHKANPRSAR